MEPADAQHSPAQEAQVICASGPLAAASVSHSTACLQSAAGATLGPAPSEAAATCPPPAATPLLTGTVRRKIVSVAEEARGKVSHVWQCFEKFDKPVNRKGSNTRCKLAKGEEGGGICGRLYKPSPGNGTSSLIDHLAKDHPETHQMGMSASAHSKETRALKMICNTSRPLVAFLLLFYIIQLLVLLIPGIILHHPPAGWNSSPSTTVAPGRFEVTAPVLRDCVWVHNAPPTLFSIRAAAAASSAGEVGRRARRTRTTLMQSCTTVAHHAVSEHGGYPETRAPRVNPFKTGVPIRGHFTQI